MLRAEERENNNLSKDIIFCLTLCTVQNTSVLQQITPVVQATCCICDIKCQFGFTIFMDHVCLLILLILIYVHLCLVL